MTSIWVAGLISLLVASVAAVDEEKSVDSNSPVPQAVPGQAHAGQKPTEGEGDSSANSKSSSPETTPDAARDLAQLVQDLVDPKFAVRQAASAKLVQSGSAGMNAVAKAAESDDLELTSRCLAVLAEGLSTADETVKKSAREALERLTKSENKSVAKRAQQALEAPLGPLPGAVIQGPRRGRVGMAAGNNIAIKIAVNNGARELRITENGKEIVITDNNGKEISVTITETLNGMKKVTAATGKDAEELKKNSPEAHAYYERYGKGNGIRIQVNGNFGAQPPQVARRIPKLINPIKAGNLLEEVDLMRQKLEAANDRLVKIVTADPAEPDGQKNEELKKIIDEIKAATNRLAEIKSESEMP